MAVDAVGAALAAVGLLLTAVIEVGGRNIMFKSYLNSLMATLKILEPLLEEVKEIKETLDPQIIREMEFYESQIKKGEERVRKCSKVGCYNICAKWYHANKLMELDQTLKSLIMYASSRHILILVRKTYEMVQRGQGISSSLGSDQVVSMLSSNAPPPPELIPPPSESEIQLAPPSPPPPPPPPPREPQPSTELELLSPPPPPRFSHNNSNIVDDNGSATCKKNLINVLKFSSVGSLQGISHLGALNFALPVVLILDGVVKEFEEARMFKPILEKLEATLQGLEPAIREIESFNRQLNLPDAETAHIRSEMDKGAELVRKCSNVSRFNVYKKSYYANKLLELDKNLHGLLQILQVQAARDAKKSLLLVQQFASQHQVISMPPPELTPLPPPPSQNISNLTNIDNNESASGTSQNNEGQGNCVAEKFLGGISLGKALELLCNALNEFQDKDVMFKPILNKLEATIQDLEPLIIQIESLNRKLDLPDRETADIKLEMDKGAELVRKCSNLPRFNFYKRSHYAKKLLELNESLRRLFQMLQVQAARDVKKNLVLVQEIHAKIIGVGGSDVELHEILSRVSSNVTSIATAPAG